jgi:hypothetical protein
MKNFTSKIAIVSAACALMVTPAMAQSRHRHSNDNATWDAAAVLSAGVGIYGASHRDSGLAALGAIGALYSLSRVHGRDCDERVIVEPRHRYVEHVVVERPRYERVVVEPRREIRRRHAW